MSEQEKEILQKYVAWQCILNEKLSVDNQMKESYTICNTCGAGCSGCDGCSGTRP